MRPEHILGRRLPHHAIEEPLADRARVDQSLARRERLRGDDDESLLWVEAIDGARIVGVVDVGEEAHLAQAQLLGVLGRLEPLVDKRGTERRAADADDDKRAERLAGGAAELAAAHALGEEADPIARLVHQRHHVLVVDDLRRR